MSWSDLHQAGKTTATELRRRTNELDRLDLELVRSLGQPPPVEELVDEAQSHSGRLDP